MDERIRSGYHKICSEALTMIVLALAASLIVKAVLGRGLEDCVTEFAVLMFLPVYIEVRRHRLGLAAEYDDGKLRRIFAIRLAAGLGGCTLLLLAVMYVRTGHIDGKAVVEFLIPFLGGFTAVAFLGRCIHRWRQKMLDKKYEEK